MNKPDLETWIVETGADVIEKAAQNGREALTPFEKLIYCAWVADYGMRNAGDLKTAREVYPDFQAEAAELATGLRLTNTSCAFRLPAEALEERYFELFDVFVSELLEHYELRRD